MVPRSIPFEVRPLQPTLVQPFHRPGWVCEEKVDGWRIVSYKTGGAVRLVSRKGIDHTARFPDLAKAVAALPGATLILDGEVAVFDENLVSRFEFLAEPHPEVATTPPVYIAFDALYARGRDLRARPLESGVQLRVQESVRLAPWQRARDRSIHAETRSCHQQREGTAHSPGGRFAA